MLVAQTIEQVERAPLDFGRLGQLARGGQQRVQGVAAQLEAGQHFGQVQHGGLVAGTVRDAPARGRDHRLALGLGLDQGEAPGDDLAPAPVVGRQLGQELVQTRRGGLAAVQAHLGRGGLKLETDHRLRRRGRGVGLLQQRQRRLEEAVLDHLPRHFQAPLRRGGQIGQRDQVFFCQVPPPLGQRQRQKLVDPGGLAARIGLQPDGLVQLLQGLGIAAPLQHLVDQVAEVAVAGKLPGRGPGPRERLRAARGHQQPDQDGLPAEVGRILCHVRPVHSQQLLLRSGAAVHLEQAGQGRGQRGVVVQGRAQRQRLRGQVLAGRGGLLGRARPFILGEGGTLPRQAGGHDSQDQRVLQSAGHGHNMRLVRRAGGVSPLIFVPLCQCVRYQGANAPRSPETRDQ